MFRLQTLSPGIFATLVVLFGSTALSQDDGPSPDADELMMKAHLAYYYAANDGRATVEMTLTDKKGRQRQRLFVMLRIDIEEGGAQKYYTYFKKPSDIARLVFMVHKSVDGNDRRWIYIPAVDLIKPISADDKNSSFVGSDFSYEDVSGRHWTEDNHRLVAESKLDSLPVYVVESKPIEAFKGFSRKLSYMDKTSFIPLKIEYFDKNDTLTKLFRAEKIETIDGIPTVTIRVMKNVRKGSQTHIEFTDVAYNVGLNENLFTERYLKSPPRKYIK